MLESAAHAVCLERQTPTAAAIRWRSNPSARRLWGLHAPTDPSKPCNRSIRMPDPRTNDPLAPIRAHAEILVLRCRFAEMERPIFITKSDDETPSRVGIA